MRFLLALFLVMLCFAPGWAKPVTLQYVRADLAMVLNKLQPYLGKNIYLSPEVKGEVTLTVTKMPAMNALDLILRLQDTPLAYKIVGNTVVVATPDRLSTIPDDLFRK